MNFTVVAGVPKAVGLYHAMRQSKMDVGEGYGMFGHHPNVRAI